MAVRKSTTKPASTKAAVLEDETEAAEAEASAEATPKQIVSEGIARVIEATGIDVQKNRYKAMRAIAFQAFLEAIESDEFDALVDRAIANVDDLPAGWEIERPAKDEAPAKPVKAAAKPAAKTATKAAAKPTAKATTARKRPTR